MSNSDFAHLSIHAIIRCQELHRHDQNSRSLQQLSLQIAKGHGQPDEMTVSWKFSTTRGREGETCILSTSLESKADMPNLLHSAFSCCAMVVRGTNIEVVEPGVNEVTELSIEGGDSVTRWHEKCCQQHRESFAPPSWHRTQNVMTVLRQRCSSYISP